MTHDFQTREVRRSTYVPTQTPSQLIPTLDTVTVRIIREREEFSLYFTTCIVIECSGQSSQKGQYVDVIFTSALRNSMKLKPGKSVIIRGCHDHDLVPRLTLICDNATDDKHNRDLTANELNDQVSQLAKKFAVTMISEEGVEP